MDYNLQNIPTLPNYILKYVMEDLKYKDQTDNSLWLEFGVFSGNTINFISKYTKKTVYGFDSFEGLPEYWRGEFDKGYFDMQGNMPIVSDNVKLIKGFFDTTLENFLNSVPNDISFIHLDADLYSSTIYVLEQCTSRISDGCIIVFDELFNFPEYDGVRSELKALKEWVDKYLVEFEWIGICGEFPERAAIKILKINKQ